MDYSATGRIVFGVPNMQSNHQRTKEGQLIRRAFILDTQVPDSDREKQAAHVKMLKDHVADLYARRHRFYALFGQAHVRTWCRAGIEEIRHFHPKA